SMTFNSWRSPADAAIFPVRFRSSRKFCPRDFFALSPCEAITVLSGGSLSISMTLRPCRRFGKFAHKIRQPQQTAAFHTLGFQNALYARQAVINVVIDQRVMIFAVMGDFIHGAAHAEGDFLTAVLPACLQTVFQLLKRGRQDEDG